MRAIAVVGASLAGLHTARALRERGYDERIVLIGEEPDPPYDRPPLSKEFLAGEIDEQRVTLLEPDDEALDVEWRLGTAATRLDASERAVELDDGSRVRADAMVVATGARAITLPGSLPLRTLADARRLRARLRPGTRLVLVGAGFIGAEIAATAAKLGAEVTVIERAPAPLAEVLGPELGAVCAGWHAQHGVRLRAGVAVRRCADGEVELDDGTRLRADVIVSGVGARPCTEWLAESGLDTRDGVWTDHRCATALPGVLAVGDCARTERASTGVARRVEHWANAVNQARIAAGTLLGEVAPPSPREELPYFWSDQYGMRLQFAGTRRADETVTIVDGDPATGAFAATYAHDGVPHAVLAVNAPKTFARLRRGLTGHLVSVS